MTDRTQPTQRVPMESAASSGADAHIRADAFNAAAHGLRGLASLLVLGAHIIGGAAHHVYAQNTGYTQAIEHPWYLGIYGVKLFFIISGFVIFPSALKYPAREFLLRRFIRIYPLFFALSLLFIILNAYTNYHPANNNIQSIVPALLFLDLLTGTEQLLPTAWSLSFEVAFYVLTCWIIHSCIKNRHLLSAGSSISTAAIFLFFYPISIFFIAGVVIRILYGRVVVDKAMLRVLEMLFFFAAIYTASRAHFEYRPADLTNPTALSSMLSTILYFFVAVDPRSMTSLALNNRIAGYFGTISYSMYLIHPFTYLFSRKLFEKFGLFTDNILMSMLGFGLTVFVLSTAASHVSYLLLERWPYQRIFHQRVYRHSPAQP